MWPRSIIKDEDGFGQLRRYDHEQSHEPDSGDSMNNSTHAIPIPMPDNHIKRTESELQLFEDMALAEYRERCMFKRLISGMEQREQMLHYESQQHQRQHRKTGPGQNQTDGPAPVLDITKAEFPDAQRPLSTPPSLSLPNLNASNEPMDSDNTTNQDRHKESDAHVIFPNSHTHPQIHSSRTRPRIRTNCHNAPPPDSDTSMITPIGSHDAKRHRSRSRPRMGAPNTNTDATATATSIPVSIPNANANNAHNPHQSNDDDWSICFDDDKSAWSPRPDKKDPFARFRTTPGSFNIIPALREDARYYRDNNDHMFDMDMPRW